MRISRRWLQRYFKTPLPEGGDLADALLFHAFEVEGIEDVLGDQVLELKVLPDRAPYALCHRGVAREVSAAFDLPADGDASRLAPPVAVADGVPAPRVLVESGGCQRYVARIVEDIEIGPSPDEVAELLRAMGQRPIHAIVDAANFVMFDMGQPLHAFDADKVVGAVSVREAHEGEIIETLDGKSVTLGRDTIVIADEKGPLAIAGIKGGARAGVTSSTRRVLLESASFDPGSVRRSSARVSIRTDASKRFENAYPAELAREGMDAFSALIALLCPAARFGPIIDIFPRPTADVSVSVGLDEVSRLLGLDLSAGAAGDALRRLHLPFMKEGKSGKERFAVAVPPDRKDIRIPQDLVEEIGRVVGYDSVPVRLPAPAPAAPSDALYCAADLIRDALADVGFSEIVSRTLSAEGTFEVAKALSDKSRLRESLSPSLSIALQKNAANAELLSLDDVCIFEIGSVFPRSGEEVRLALAAAQTRKRKGANAEAIVAEGLAAAGRAIGADLSGTEIQHLPGKAGAIAEISLSSLSGPSVGSPMPFTGSSATFKPYSQYPFIVRDIAVFVPSDISPEEVWREIEPHGTDLLVAHRLFDVYEKKGEDGVSRTSYAFRMVLQASDRTLTDAEANQVASASAAALVARGWQVR